MGLGLWDENASKTVSRGPAAHLLPTSGEGRGGKTLNKQNNKGQADHLGTSENSVRAPTPPEHTRTRSYTTHVLCIHSVHHRTDPVK